MINVLLMCEIADKIEADPESHHQLRWASIRVRYPQYLDYVTTYFSEQPQGSAVCGTAYCIAGWACVLSGYNFGIRNRDGYTWVSDEVTAPDGRTYEPGVAGRHLLGLDPETGRNLFSGIWRPRVGLTVPDALRALAAGARYWDVSQLRASALLPMEESDPLPLHEVRALAASVV